MIIHTYINGIQVDSDKCFLQKAGAVGMAEVEFANYQRGGVSGQILSRPLYRGFNIGLQYFVKGASNDDFITQRDRLVGYLQNSSDVNSYLKTLGFELSDGTIKEIDVVFSQVTSDLMPENFMHSVFTVSAISEREFLTSRTVKTATVIKVAGGGMAIPMPIPMSMANGSTADLAVLTNAGNANAYPTIRVHGGFTSSFNLINDTTSQTLTFTGALAEGSYIDIDLYDRTAIKNLTNSVLGSISGDWLYLAPGTNQVRVTSSDELDSGYAVITYNDTYRNI